MFIEDVLLSWACFHRKGHSKISEGDPVGLHKLVSIMNSGNHKMGIHWNNKNTLSLSPFFFQVNGDHLEPLITPTLQVGSTLSSKEDEGIVNQLRDVSLLQDTDLNTSL